MSNDPELRFVIPARGPFSSGSPPREFVCECGGRLVGGKVHIEANGALLGESDAKAFLSGLKRCIQHLDVTEGWENE